MTSSYNIRTNGAIKAILIIVGHELMENYATATQQSRGGKKIKIGD